MGYTTQQGLIDRYGAEELIQLTDRANVPPSFVDAAVVARALSDADALIDGYVGRVADLPLSATPPLLERLAADVARYLLHGKAADETVRQAYDDAIRTLRDIANGTVRLDLGGDPPPPAGAGGVQIAGPDRIFSRKSLGGL